MSYISNSEDISQLASAMCKVQSEIENVVKEASNPFFRTKYADLGSILSHCRPILSKHGLSVIQFPVNGNGHVGVETIILHESGQSLKASVSVPMPEVITQKDGTQRNLAANEVVQAVGSTITYLRRYAYAAVVGVAQVDDDGNLSKPDKVEMIMPSQRERIDIMMKDVRVCEKATDFMKKKGKSFSELTKEEASSFMQWANDLIRTTL